MNKRLISVMTIAMTVALSASSQNTHRMGIGDMFGLIEENNISIKSEKTGIEAAREGVKAAKSQRLPDISAQVSASYIGNAAMMDRDFTNVQWLSSPHFGNNFSLDARQVVYAGGAIDAGIRLAELGVEQASLGTQLNRQSQRFVALGHYLDLEKIANRMKVLESNIELTQKLIDNIKEKHAQGVALENDVTRYELQKQTLQLNLVKLRNTRSILNHQLCNTLGLPTTDEIIPTDDVASQLYDTLSEGRWQADAAGLSPQLQMAGVGVQMAKQSEKLAKSEMLPKIAIVAQDNFNGPITFELPPVDKNLNTWYVGVGVQYNISSLFKSNKKVSQARLVTRQAQEKRELAAEHVNNQMQAAYTNYLQSYVELETQIKNEELARQNYEIINDRYLNQLALITDMIDASNMKLDAELSKVDAKINIAYSYYKMKYVAGNL